MIWVSRTVLGFQELLKRDSKIRAVQQFCVRLVLCRETEEKQFIWSGFTLTFSLFPFHTLLATVFLEGGKKLNELTWEKENSHGIKDNDDIKKLKVHIIYTVNIFSFKEINYKESLSSF